MMSTSKLLEIKPRELIFLHELGKRTSCSLELFNKTDEYVAFKMMTGNPNKYAFTPNKGFVLPRSTVNITVAIQAPKKIHPHRAGYSDWFCIRSTVVVPEVTKSDMTPELFRKLDSEHQVEHFMMWAHHIQAMMSTRECQLNVDPQDLHFLFESGKTFSCDVQLFNKSNNYLAFKVKTTNPKRYKIEPDEGVLVPRSLCKVIVTLKPPEQAPADMPCKDKFFVNSVVVTPGTTRRDITPELFYEKYSPHQMEKFELRVFHIDKIMGPGEHFHFEPQNVKIPLRTEFPCFLQLLNKRDNWVGFEMNIKPLNQYLFAPTFAYVPARSTCNIRVLFPALEEAPPDMKCNDLFHIQSVELVPGTPTIDYNYIKMFDKKLGHPIHEFMMRASFVDVEENQDVAEHRSATVNSIPKRQTNLVSNETSGPAKGNDVVHAQGAVSQWTGSYGISASNGGVMNNTNSTNRVTIHSINNWRCRIL